MNRIEYLSYLCASASLRLCVKFFSLVFLLEKLVGKLRSWLGFSPGRFAFFLPLCCVLLLSGLPNLKATLETSDAALSELNISKASLKIGIITGVKAEADHLLTCFDPDYTITHKALRDYYHGTLWGKDTVLVSSRCGKAAAAITATTLILEEKVDLIIVIGTAGAIDDALHVGDVVVASSLIQHDIDGRPIIPPYTIPILRIRELKPALTLQNMALRACQNCIQEGLNFLPLDALEEFKLTAPKVYSGLIGSGDQFIADPHKRKALKNTLEELLCVEMEGAAVAQVCYEHGIPLIVIRILSDQSDGQAAIDCFKFVKTVAAVYASQIIKHLYPLLTPITL